MTTYTPVRVPFRPRPRSRPKRLSFPPPPPSLPLKRRRLLHLTRSALLASFVIILLLSSELSFLDLFSQLGIRPILLRHRRVLTCARPARLGDANKGWQLCIPTRWSLQRAIVYSVGFGRDIAWDRRMIAKYATEHHGWDPSPTALEYIRKSPPPQGFVFHRIGMGPRDGNQTIKLPYGNHDSYTVMAHPNDALQGTVMEVPILTASSMMKRMGHTHLAILKMDIEGGEFDVIDEWARLGYRVPADQVLIEFHERYFWKRPGYRNLVPNAVQKMRGLGFKLVVRTKVEYTFARAEAIVDDDGEW